MTELLIFGAVTVVCLAVSAFCIRRLLNGLADEDPDAWTREAQQGFVDPNAKDGDA